MSHLRFNPKLVAGKKIVRIDMRPSIEESDSGETRVTMHDPIIYLDDGSSLVFLVEEHPIGANYGVDIVRRKKKS